jgi:hypothetical protein
LVSATLADFVVADLLDVCFSCSDRARFEELCEPLPAAVEALVAKSIAA